MSINICGTSLNRTLTYWGDGVEGVVGGEGLRVTEEN